MKTSPEAVKSDEAQPKEAETHFSSPEKKAPQGNRMRPSGSESFTNEEFGQGYRVVKEKK